MVVRNRIYFTVVKLTRAQANAEITQEDKDKLSLEASGASTHFISDIFNFSDEVFGEDPVNTTSLIHATETFALPTITEDPSDRLLLIDQQKTDSTLHTIRQLAERQERGYSFLNGVLVHADQLNFDPVQHVVLPLSRRSVARKYACTVISVDTGG